MKLNPNNFNMWYTPENMRPPLDQDYDVFLSHDTDDYDGRNLYLPIWATRLAGTLDASILRQREFTKPRNTNGLNKKGICAVISNPEPVRMAFIKELRKYVPVDIYGALGKPIEDKNEILSQYKFNICFENDHFPGYVTEKPIEAWENGCIPIWWGNDIKNYLNPEAIIDVSKLGFMAAIEEISASLISDDKYQSIFRQPLLNKEFNFEKLNETIQNIAKTRRESYKQNSRF
jgi:hypothetical protein